MSTGRVACAGLSLLVAACGGPRLVTVPTGPQPKQAQAVKVDYPPPPAKIEEIRIAKKSGTCVWRDGYWDWAGGRWEWQDGRAVLPSTGCLYAEPKLRWTTESLLFYRPVWYPDPALKPAPKCIEIACVPPPAAGESTEQR